MPKPRKEKTGKEGGGRGGKDKKPLFAGSNPLPRLPQLPESGQLFTKNKKTVPVGHTGGISWPRLAPPPGLFLFLDLFSP